MAVRELGRAEGVGEESDGRDAAEPQLPARSDDDRRRADRAMSELRQEMIRQRYEAREARIAEAAERGISREEFVAKEEGAREDARQAEELSSARDKIKNPAVWGPPETHEAQRREPYERQDRALKHFRTVPVEGPDNTPLDPDRERKFPATAWSEYRPVIPPGDLSRRDELVYERYEGREEERESESFRLPGGRTDLAGSTQPVGEPLQERYPAGVDYTETGHPDLGRYASKTVELRQGFDRPDRAEVDDRVNVIFGWESTPEGKTWHKSGDGRTVWLVDTELHEQYGHADAAKDQGPLRLATTDPEHKELLNHPPPDSTVVVDERFTYRTDHLGRVVHASAKLEVVDLDHPRDKSAQSQLIGKLPGDHAGHLFARVFQGPGETINLTAMEGNKVNLGQFKSAENTWRRAVEDGRDVKVDISLVYATDTPRPDALQLTWWIDGERDERFIYNTPRPNDTETI